MYQTQTYFPAGARGAPAGPIGPKGPEGTFRPFGKRVTWVHLARAQHRSFWVRTQKWTLHFGPLGPEKRPKRPDSGHRREKPNRWLRRHRNFARSTPWNRPDWWKNGPLRPVFRRKSVFTRQRVRVGGAGGTKVPFRCNSLRRSTLAGPKGRKVPRNI